MDSRPVTLEEILDSREARAAFQRTLAEGYGMPLVCLTVNLPGPVKADERSARIFRAAVVAVRERLAGYIRYSKLRDRPTGPEGYFVVDMPAHPLKLAMCRIEETAPLGRLMDLDVLDDGARIIGRESLGRPPRPCLICGAAGPGCARSRAHSLEALDAKIAAMLAASPDERDEQ